MVAPYINQQLAGKVTVGLASHWLCVTDFNGLSTYGRSTVEPFMYTPHGLWYSLPFLYQKKVPTSLLPYSKVCHCQNFLKIIRNFVRILVSLHM